VEAKVLLERESAAAHLYVIGPLTSDIGAGYDHTGAIGGAVAAAPAAMSCAT